MNRSTSLTCALSLLLLAAGCSDPPAPTGDAPAAKAAAEKAVEPAEKLAKETLAEAALDGAITPADYEKLLLGLAECAVESNGIDRDCAGWKAFDGARKDRKTLMRNLAGELGEIGRRHLGHESPAVRLQAARLASSLFGGDDDSRKALVEAAKAEKNPHVLRAILRSVRSSIGRSDAVRDLLVSMVEHPDEQVRITVLGALAASWARDTEGTLEKVLAAVENDPSPRVRAYACRQLGDRADPRALPLLEKLTAGPKGDGKLYADCFRGLIGMWAAPVPHKTPNQKAYRLTLTRLRATPRTEQMPPWAAIPNLEWAARAELAENAPWFDKSALIEALEGLALDRASHWLARTGAIKTMVKLGARTARLQGIEKAYADAAATPGADKHVHEEVLKALAARAKAAELKANGGKRPEGEKGAAPKEKSGAAEEAPAQKGAGQK